MYSLSAYIYNNNMASVFYKVRRVRRGLKCTLALALLLHTHTHTHTYGLLQTNEIVLYI